MFWKDLTGNNDPVLDIQKSGAGGVLFTVLVTTPQGPT